MSTAGRGRPASEVSEENHFGTWLRKRRRIRDLTGEALAIQMGGKLTQSSISHYERGTKKPEAATVFLLADALGADPREALEALMADTLGTEHHLQPQGELEHRAAAAFGKLSAEEQESFLLLIERVAGIGRDKG